MAAPFDLPDLCDIERLGFPEPIAVNVPCRQVPNMIRGRAQESNVNQLQWTHWVDFQPDVDVQDNAFVAAGGVRVEAAAGGDVIVIITPETSLSLHVIWVEDRYTGTPANYQRAYCVRTFRET